LSAKTE
jgi:DNA replication protein DnaC